MGACLCKGGEDCSDPGRDHSSRKRCRSAYGPGSSRSCIDRGGSNHYVPPPDFGVSSLYRVMELLGEGGTGQTWLCQDLKSHRRVAIKFIPRPLAKVLVPMVSQEIQLQAQLSEGHLGLVRVESALLSKSHLGLVMEYVDGGTLTHHVTKRAANKGERGGLHLTEDEARYFFRQLIPAVEYLHASHVAHRDLKMCNVVLTQRRPPTLKLCDFGFAKGWDESSMMATRIGTPVYMSPQLIESKNEGKTYSATAADVWACGVMLFAMLLGRFPYDHVGHPDPNSSGAHVEVWNEQMKASNGDWRSAPRVAPHVDLLSDDCKDLLGKMLELDERRRITIPDIRKHAWFTAELPPYLDEALRDCEERQARLAKVMEAATEAQIKRRNKAVHDLIVMAGQPYNTVEPSNRRLGSGAISAIFEVGTECEAGSTGGSFGPLHSRTLSPASPAATPEKDGADGGGGGKSHLGPALAMAGSSVEGRAPDRAASSRSDSEVITIELAAVAKRTKSDGLVLMAAYDPDAAEGGESRNCNSSESSSDPAAEGCSCGGAATAVGGGGGEESLKAACEGRPSLPVTATSTVVTCEARGTAVVAPVQVAEAGAADEIKSSEVAEPAAAAAPAEASNAAAAGGGGGGGSAVVPPDIVDENQVALEPATEAVATVAPSPFASTQEPAAAGTGRAGPLQEQQR